MYSSKVIILSFFLLAIFFMLLLVLLLAIDASTNEIITVNSEKVITIHVYYETQCPDSRSFIIEQLSKANVYVYPHGSIAFKLVPYGKASVNKLLYT